MAREGRGALPLEGPGAEGAGALPSRLALVHLRPGGLLCRLLGAVAGVDAGARLELPAQPTPRAEDESVSSPVEN